MINKLTRLIKENNFNLVFQMLEIGGVPLGGPQEPFYQLLEFFPGSKIIAFEVDKELCDDLNNKSNGDIVFYPMALGSKEETRDFYITNHSMCCSLYSPNDELNSLYNNLEVAYLKEKTTIDTVTLDYFANKHNIQNIDFIKIDIQGAELDVFQNALQVLKDVAFIVTEVEFIHHYKDQPLFGDVNNFLYQHNFMFHKFIGLAGRSLAPLVIDNNPNMPSQLIWSDAIFIKNILNISKLTVDKLLKLSVLSLIYGSPDLTYYCLNQVDIKLGTQLHIKFLQAE
jgi:FkbM family methyltransferase